MKSMTATYTDDKENVYTVELKLSERNDFKVKFKNELALISALADKISKVNPSYLLEEAKEIEADFMNISVESFNKILALNLADFNAQFEINRINRIEKVLRYNKNKVHFSL